MSHVKKRISQWCKTCLTDGRSRPLEDSWRSALRLNILWSASQVEGYWNSANAKASKRRYTHWQEARQKISSHNEDNSQEQRQQMAPRPCVLSLERISIVLVSTNGWENALVAYRSHFLHPDIFWSPSQDTTHPGATLLLRLHCLTLRECLWSLQDCWLALQLIMSLSRHWLHNFCHWLHNFPERNKLAFNAEGSTTMLKGYILRLAKQLLNLIRLFARINIQSYMKPSESLLSSLTYESTRGKACHRSSSWRQSASPSNCLWWVLDIKFRRVILWAVTWRVLFDLVSIALLTGKIIKGLCCALQLGNEFEFRFACRNDVLQP